MADQAEERGLLEDLTKAAEAVSRLAKDEHQFRCAVDAYWAQDGESLRLILEELQLLERCRLVCDWICSKECTLVCLELCGPPPQEPAIPDLRAFADVVGKVAADEDAFEELIGAVGDRDAEAYRALVKRLEIEPFSHLICHWVCAVRCRLICEIVCSPRPGRWYPIVGVRRVNAELINAAAAIRSLADNPQAVGEVERGVLLDNCDIVRDALAGIGLQEECTFICEWLCSWRCVRVCFPVCRLIPPGSIESPIREMIEFGRALDRFDPATLERLNAALIPEDPEKFASLVRELGLERFCIQLCHWLCYVRCFWFCRCVCRPPFNNPWFTHVGHFHIYGDINASTGLTNGAVLGHGGPDYGFFGCLELRGFCPKTSPTFPGVPMRYRFLFEHPAGTKVPLTGALLCEVIAGSRLILWDIFGTGLQWTFQTIKIAGAGATPPVTPPPSPLPPPGTPWGAPPPHVIVPDPDGWIEVDANALDDGFNGALIGFNTTQPFPDGDPAPGVVAGTPVPPASLRNGRAIGIIFEATRVGGPTSPPDFTNSLTRIHINNWYEVRLLNLLQFHTGGGTPCSPLTTDLDIEYTTDHEVMAAWGVGISTAAPIVSPPLPSGVGPRGGAGTHHENIASWPSCSYTVSLTTRRALTTGIVDDSDKTTSVTFCK
jgi:hypothetical protein